MRTIGTIAVALSWLALAGCGKKEAAPQAAEAPAVRVNVVHIQPEAFPLTVAVTGSLVSPSRVDVKAETTGRMLRFPKEEGDPVAAGETLAWVDEENYRLAVRQAEGACAVAEAELARARVAASHAQTELERAQNLVRSGGITDKDLKAAELAEQDSKAQVQLAEAQVALNRAALETARKHLRDTAIKAPVAGEIQKKHINAGAYVEPSTAVVTLVDNRKLELESLVASSEIGPIRAGQKVTFTVNSFPGQTFEGRVIELNPAVEADTRSAKIRIQVNNAGGKLRAGMFAQGEILTGVEAQAIVVPASAVYRDDRAAKTSHVFVVESGKAVRRQVEIGREKETSLEIVSGLRAGDTLITEQSIELADGVRVEPVAVAAGK
jgi:membrane fusion protein (multidrug efflux system)